MLWPTGIKYEKLKLPLTDDAACIWNRCEEVNALISNVKKVFLKAHLRIQGFRGSLPSCLLPPEPVLTRWGSWIEAAIYTAFQKNCNRE